MFSKTVFERAIVALYLISLCSVFGLPERLPNQEEIQTLLEITGSTALEVAKDAPIIGGVVENIEDAVRGSCTTEYGCYSGKCWARCYAVPLVRGKEWCYTTKSYSQSYEKVDCTQDMDCNGCWKCASSCTV